MVGDFHLLQDRRTIVRDCDVAVGGDEDLVEAAGTERALDDVGDRPRGEDVVLDGLVAVLTLLLALAVQGGQWEGDKAGGPLLKGRGWHESDILSNNDEGAALLILHHRRCANRSVVGSWGEGSV